MSELHGPKCQEMRFPAFQFSKIFRGSMPLDPPRSDGLKPSYGVRRTHNRLLFTKLWLLKNLYTALYTCERGSFFNKIYEKKVPYIQKRLGIGPRHGNYLCKSLKGTPCWRVLWLPFCFLTSQTISETSSVCLEGCSVGWVHRMF